MSEGNTEPRKEVGEIGFKLNLGNILQTLAVVGIVWLISTTTSMQRDIAVLTSQLNASTETVNRVEGKMNKAELDIRSLQGDVTALKNDVNDLKSKKR